MGQKSLYLRMLALCACALLTVLVASAAPDLPADSGYRLLLEKALPDDKPLALDLVMRDGRCIGGYMPGGAIGVDALKLADGKLTGSVALELPRGAVKTKATYALDVTVAGDKLAGAYVRTRDGGDVKGAVTGTVVPLPRLAGPRVWGYRYDGTGVFPEDCRPVTTWREFDSVPNTARGAKVPVLLDPAKPVMTNVVWKVPLPNMSESTPLVVGRKVFTVCEPGYPEEADCPRLVCLDADSGAILWQRDIDQFENLPEAKRAEARRLRQEFFAASRRGFALLHAKNNALARGDAEAAQKAADAMRALGCAQEKLMNPKVGTGLFANQAAVFGNPNVVKALMRTYNWVIPLWQYTTVGLTYASPCTDGANVYVATAYGAVAAFDLNGERKWLTWGLDPASGRNMSVGNNNNTFSANSPVVVGDRVLTRACGYLFGLDTATGKIVWEIDITKDAVDKKFSVDTVATGQYLRIGDTDVVLQPRGLAVRPSDGKVLADPVIPEMRGMDQLCYAVDRARSIVYFGTGGHSGFKEWNGHQIGARRFAVQLAMDGPDKLTGAILWAKDVSLGNVTPVLYQGRLYTGRGVIDPNTGDITSPLKVDGAQGWQVADNRLWGGLCHDAPFADNAPIDTNGTLGATARNYLGHLGPFSDEQRAKMAAYGGDGIGTWYGWTIGRGYPYFSGNRVFYRTFDHLYCIGKTDEPFRPSAAFAAAE